VLYVFFLRSGFIFRKNSLRSLPVAQWLFAGCCHDRAAAIEAASES
jgi:hypothetical protein